MIELISMETREIIRPCLKNILAMALLASPLSLLINYGDL
jgi:hypothetical protein